MTENLNLIEIKKQVARGICMECFWLRFGEQIEQPRCDKFNIMLKTKIISCDEFLKFAEGLDELILTMRARGELSEDINSN
ncbi:hypothetical protein MYX76_12745 [Desulfobacterota bacterium AH_259_B03_O07]|nr:hypothetical protein [Desulfobacterota bacterium AH_259_B03_O07]